MPQIHAYLTFNGNCAEAMRFYERTLGGKLEDLIPFGSTPGAEEMPQLAEQIMHARLVLDGGTLMASDNMSGPYEAPRGIAVTLIYPEVAEGQRVFDALAEGAKVTMPFGKTFWAEGFGMLVDRFGTPWMVNAGMGS